MEKAMEETKRVLRKVDLGRGEVNRKLIAGVFVGTGVVSLIMWLQGGGVGNWKMWGEKTYVFEKRGEGREVVAKLGEGGELVAKIKDMVATASGTYGIYIYEPDTKYGFGINEREKMPGASILKVPAMVAVLEKLRLGDWKLEKEFGLEERDRSPGSGPLQYLPAGAKVSVERILSEMGKKSDNTAWLMVNRLVGLEAIEEVMLDLGMMESDYRDLTTTAADVGRMFAGLPQEVRAYLVDSIYEDRIPAGIKDAGVSIVHKVGTLDDVWADAGIVMPQCEVLSTKCEGAFRLFVVVILNKGVKREEAVKLVPEVARTVWEYEVSRGGKD